MAEKAVWLFLLLMRTADRPLVDGQTVRGTLSNHPNYVLPGWTPRSSLTKKLKVKKSILIGRGV